MSITPTSSKELSDTLDYSYKESIGIYAVAGLQSFSATYYKPYYRTLSLDGYVGINASMFIAKYFRFDLSYLNTDVDGKDFQSVTITRGYTVSTSFLFLISQPTKSSKIFVGIYADYLNVNLTWEEQDSPTWFEQEFCSLCKYTSGTEKNSFTSLGFIVSSNLTKFLFSDFYIKYLHENNHQRNLQRSNLYTTVPDSRPSEINFGIQFRAGLPYDF